MAAFGPTYESPDLGSSGLERIGGGIASRIMQFGNDLY